MTQARFFLGAGASCIVVSLCLTNHIASAQPQDENLAGLAAGAIVLKGATSAVSGAAAWFMLDEDATTGWKEVLVEISDTSATDGFKPLLRATLTAAPKDGQRFKAAAEMSGGGCAYLSRRCSSRPTTSPRSRSFAPLA